MLQIRNLGANQKKFYKFLIPRVMLTVVRQSTDEISGQEAVQVYPQQSIHKKLLAIGVVHKVMRL